MSKPSTQQPKQYNWLLAIAVIILALFPMLFVRGEYKGADDRSGDAIKEINPDYKEWFKPILEPASGEIETFLFATQAALGAGVIGYVIGRYKGRAETLSNQSQKQQPPDDQSPK